MSEDGDMWREIKRRGRNNRQHNRKHGLELMKTNKLDFEVKNDGAHIIITEPDCMIDYWPGTGKWHIRFGKKGHGVFNLLREIRPSDRQDEVFD